jgi:RNA-binding protein Nova
VVVTENVVYGCEPPMHGHIQYEPKSRIKTTHLIQMEIPNSIVGAIVGKQGQTINEFTRASGAHINFSAKDEFAPGTTNRILTIKGGKNQIQNAYMLIDQKIAQVGYQFYSNGLVYM